MKSSPACSSACRKQCSRRPWPICAPKPRWSNPGEPRISADRDQRGRKSPLSFLSSKMGDRRSGPPEEVGTFPSPVKRDRGRGIESFGRRRPAPGPTSRRNCATLSGRGRPSYAQRKSPWGTTSFPPCATPETQDAAGNFRDERRIAREREAHRLGESAGATPTITELRRGRVAGGFAEPVRLALASDPALVAEIARRLLNAP